MKKLLSILLVYVMLLSLAPATLASGEAELPAAEAVEEDLPAEEAIEDPAEEPVEEPTEEPVVEPADEDIEEPADEPAQDGAVEKYDLWVGGVQVTSENAHDILGDGKARYDRSTMTLTFYYLTGFSDYYVDSYNTHYGVYAREDLTIAGAASFSISVMGAASYGIYTSGVLTIANGANLTIRTHNTALEGFEGVIINGGYINVESSAGSGIKALGMGLEINGGTVNSKAMCFGLDVQSGGITLNNGDVNVVGTGGGSYTGIRLISGLPLTVNGGVLDVSNTAGGKAIDNSDHITFASTHAITEGTLSGSHFCIAPKGHISYYFLWVGGVRVSSANASDILGDNTASYDRASRTLTFNGLTGMNDYYVEGNKYYGVNSLEDLTVTGKASFSMDTPGESYGIYTSGVLTIADGADLTISVNNDAIRGDDGMYIDGGTVNVTSRSGSGIRATEGAGLVVQGGTVNVNSGCIAINIQTSTLSMYGGTITAINTVKDYPCILLVSGGAVNVKGGVLDVTNLAGGFSINMYYETVTIASTHVIAEGSLKESHFRIAPKVRINRVDLSALTAPPPADQLANADGVLASGSNCTILRQYWLDKDGSWYYGTIAPDETYIYRAMFLPKDGYTFGEYDTKIPVYLNGEKIDDGVAMGMYIGSEYYGDGLFLELPYHVPKNEITSIDLSALTAELPEGQTVQADGKLTSASGCRFVSQKWTLKGKTEAFTGAAEAGKTYVYSAVFEEKDGYWLGGVGSNPPIYLNGTKLGDTKVWLQDGKLQAYFTMEYTVPSHNITAVSLTVGEPEAGIALADTHGSVSAVSHCYIFKDGWYFDADATEPVPSRDFIVGNTYYYAAWLKPLDGYQFPGTGSGDSGSIDLNAKVNGSDAAGVYWYAGGKLTTPRIEDLTGLVRVTAKFTLTGDYSAGDVLLSGLTMPVTGAKPKAAAIRGITGSDWSITEQGWYKNVDLTEKADTFEEGTRYFYGCVITMSPGLYFATEDGTNTFVGKVYVNGEQIEQMTGLVIKFKGGPLRTDEFLAFKLDNEGTAGVMTIVLALYPGPETEHDWGEWTQTKANSCTEDGEETRVCDICGEKETRVVPATGHNWSEWTQTKAPTCTDKGEETRTCPGCGGKETREVAATGHNFGAWTQTKAPTCTDNGEETRVCGVCGEKETREITAPGHEWSEWTRSKAPNYFAAGEEYRVCYRCGTKETREIPKLTGTALDAARILQGAVGKGWDTGYTPADAAAILGSLG